MVAPTPEQVGSPRGDNTGNYNITQSFELGYRFEPVGGNEGMYRSVDNYGNGIRLLGSNLSVNSKDGHGHYFDEILLNTIGPGQRPLPERRAAHPEEQPVPLRHDLAAERLLQSRPDRGRRACTSTDTIRRLQDHDLTLLPQSQIRFNVGYSRNTEDGPALSTAQEFDAHGSGLPVFTNVRRQWNEYRLGADVDLAGFKFTFLRRWDFFKDDTPFTSAGVFAARYRQPTRPCCSHSSGPSRSTARIPAGWAISSRAGSCGA